MTIIIVENVVLIDNANADHVGNCLQNRYGGIRNLHAAFDDRVSKIALRAVGHVLDVDALCGEDCGDLGKHTGNVAVAEADAADAGVGDGNGRVVHGVADVTRRQVFNEGLRRHDRAVILALLGGCAKVRNVHGVRKVHGFGNREVGDISGAGIYIVNGKKVLIK